MCSDCRPDCTNKIIKVSENKSSFEIDNPMRASIEVVKVDGCKITEGTRCDWLFIDNESKKETFVELKGTCIEHGFEQIKKTISVLSRYTKEKNGVIVCSRCPLTGSDVFKLKKKAKEMFNFKLEIKSKVFKCKVDGYISER